MDATYYSPLQIQNRQSCFLDSLGDSSCSALAFDRASDSGYYSAGSSLSPTSSVDSFCFSPTSQEVLDTFVYCSPTAQNIASKAPSCSSASTKRKSRSKYPGKKRETASEREKLRMRDLTKALHHLRSYLPASLVPGDQTLTKIETLRHTIRYISYLSAQLGLSEEVLEQRKSSGLVEVPQTLSQFLAQPGEVQQSPALFISSPQVQNSFDSALFWSPQEVLHGPLFAGQH
ncbi:uncharacterized protein ACB057_002841 [Neosynchiropus ocellatus]